MLRQSFVHESEVRIDQGCDGPVRVNQLAKETPRLQPRRFRPQFIEIVIRRELRVGRVGIALTQIKAVVEKRVDETIARGIGKQPVNGRTYCFPVC